MDIWGSIFRDRFNDRLRDEYKKNVIDFLTKLRSKYPDLYQYDDSEIDSVADELRNNLVHNYGLRILSTGKNTDWPTIDVNVVGPVVNKVENNRWHVDCARLKIHVLEVIETWLKAFNYI